MTQKLSKKGRVMKMTNEMQEQVSGVVTAVGDKFNGSLKVNGVWYSNKKGFKSEAKVGDIVTLELSPWEFKDKKGLSITAVSIKAQPKSANEAVKQVVEKINAGEIKMRDFDAENRGKVRHGLTVALVPLVAQEVINVDKLKEIVDSLVEYVMTGR